MICRANAAGAVRFPTAAARTAACPSAKPLLVIGLAARDQLDGTPVYLAKADHRVDVNDVISSQGIRLGQYEGLSGAPWMRRPFRFRTLDSTASTHSPFRNRPPGQCPHVPPCRAAQFADGDQCGLPLAQFLGRPRGHVLQRRDSARLP